MTVTGGGSSSGVSVLRPLATTYSGAELADGSDGEKEEKARPPTAPAPESRPGPRVRSVSE